jgi:hypothetical protein
VVDQFGFWNYTCTSEEKMISVEHVVPMKNKIEIEIPSDYINKEIEIILRPVEKKEKKDSKKESILALKGILGKVDFDPKMKDKAWESAVEEKFF